MSKKKSTDESVVGKARTDEAYALLVAAEPMKIKVGGQWAVVRPHPASLLFPVVSREEFGALVADVAEHGFKHFPHLHKPGATTVGTFSYGGDMEVVEGRHRVAVAYALQKTLSIQKFLGTDEDARVLVVSSNLHRRHLTKAQEALIVCETFLPIAKANAEERMRAGGAKGGKGSLSGGPPSEDVKPSLKAAEEASRMSGGLVSRASIERMQIVTREGTPVTHRRVWTGQVTSVLAAHKEATAELAEREEAARKAAAAAEPEPEEDEEETTRSPRIVGVGAGLRKAVEALSKDVAELRTGVRPLLLTPDEQRDLLTEIRLLITEWYEALDRDDDPTRRPLAHPDGTPF